MRVNNPFLVTLICKVSLTTPLYIFDDMEYHGAAKLGVEDLGIEGHPQRAELLDLCYQPDM